MLMVTAVICHSGRHRLTAVYLEEFSLRRTGWTDLIEVNINNLAAVPSIVYGLLGRGPVHQLDAPAQVLAASPWAVWCWP